MADLEPIGFNEAAFHDLVRRVKELTGEITRLKEENSVLKEENAHLKEQVKTLEGRLSQDSHNSSKPPSSDGFKKKVVNLRKKTNKHPRGQSGHPGRTLKMSEHVDEVIWHKPYTCCDCGMDYMEENTVERRQVFDLPPIKMQVQEHRRVAYRCGRCGQSFYGKFPASVSHPDQYCTGIQSLASRKRPSHGEN